MVHCFAVMVDTLFLRMTFNGNLILLRCSFLFAAKLKKKSSNNSSAAFGIGVSEMICSMVSTAAVCVALSVLSFSLATDFLSVQPSTDRPIRMVVANADTIKRKPFLIRPSLRQTCCLPNFWQIYDFISICSRIYHKKTLPLQ